MEGIIKCVCGLFLVFVICDIVLMAPRGGVKFRRRSDVSGKGKHQCTEWTFGVCLPDNGTCGKGVKLAKRSGDCRLQEKLFKCVLPCTDAATNTDTGFLGHRSGKNDHGRLNQDDDLNHRRKNKLRKKKQRRKKNKECRYARGRWTPCDPATNMRTRISVLKRGKPECPRIQTVDRKCKNTKGKKGCKYGRSESSIWSDCDPKTNKMSMVMTLQRGDADRCQPEKIRHKPCKHQKGTKKKNKKKCRYERSKWSPCDSATNTTTQILTVKRSSPKDCEATKFIRKPCKKVCRYTKGKWSKCNSTSSTKMRLDTLSPESHGTCPPTREHMKDCQVKKHTNKCQYEYGTWSDCVDGKRTRTRTLKPESPTECSPTKVSQRSCTLKNGEERCFFGPWETFGSCQNGVKTKTRPVIAGGDNCHRRGVKTKPCPAN